MTRIDYSSSVIWIPPKKITCPSGKLETEFTGPIAKSTSPRLSDTTFFARCPHDFFIIAHLYNCVTKLSSHCSQNFINFKIGDHDLNISALKKSMWNADWHNDIIILGTCFSMFVYIRVCFHFTLIGWNLTAQLMECHRGIRGGIQVPVASCCLVASSPSFSCPTPRAPWRACLQATECVVTTCIWYWVQVLEHSSDSVCIQSVEPCCNNKGPRGWQNVFMIVRFCYIKVILLLLGQKILFDVPRTLLCGGSLYSGSTVC